MTGKADIRKWDKKKRRNDSRNTTNSYQESRATKFTPQGSGNNELIRPQSEGDLNMNTFDIINLDRMIFATDAGAGDVLANTEYGIEAIAPGGTAYGLTYQIPSSKIHSFKVGSVGSLVISGTNIIATVDMTTANINLGPFKIKYSEISTPSPNPNANEGFMYSKDVSGVTTPMWLDSAGTETSLLGAGGWVGTATSDLNMNTWDITNLDRIYFAVDTSSFVNTENVILRSAAGFYNNLGDSADTYAYYHTGSKNFEIADAGIFTRHIDPLADNTYDIGSPATDYVNAYVQKIHHIKEINGVSPSGTTLMKFIFDSQEDSDTFISNSNSNADRINFTVNAINTMWLVDNGLGAKEIGMIDGNDIQFNIGDNWMLLKGRSVPANPASNSQANLFFDSSDDTLKIRKKNSSGTSSTVSLEGSGSSGANTTLSNLGTTAINASLNPSSTSSIDLGSSTKKWRYIYAVQLVGAAVTASSLGMSGDIDMNGNDIDYVGGFTNTGNYTFAWSGSGSFQVDSNICALYSPTTYLGNTGDSVRVGGQLRFDAHTSSDTTLPSNPMGKIQVKIGGSTAYIYYYSS